MNVPQHQTSESLAAWVFRGLTLLFIVFIITASWTPADVARQESLFSNFTGIRDLFRGHNLRDIATNILLYLPLGVFSALAISSQKIRILHPLLLLGTLVSLTMEVGQFFIGRTPDLVDIITNSSGHIIGFVLVVNAVNRYGLNPMVLMGFDPTHDLDKKNQTIAALRFIIICVYILIAMLPFDISVQFSDIYAQLLPDDTGVPLIILNPSYILSHWETHGQKLTIELWALLPVALLTAFLGAIRGRLHILGPVFAVVFLSGFCEFCQLFILSRRTDIQMIPVALLAGILAWGLVRVWMKVQHIESSELGQTAGQAQSLALAILGYALVIGFFAWSPFTFESDITAVFEKIRHDSNLIPFKQHFATRNLGSAVDIVKEVGLYAPLGLLIARLLFQLRPQIQGLAKYLFVGMFCGFYAFCIELSQSVVIGRYIDITDALLGGFGGICGAVLLQLFLLPRILEPSDNTIEPS